MLKYPPILRHGAVRFSVSEKYLIQFPGSSHDAVRRYGNAGIPYKPFTRLTN